VRSLGLIGDLVAAGVGGDEHPAVTQMEELAVTDDLDRLAGQPLPRQIT